MEENWPSLFRSVVAHETWKISCPFPQAMQTCVLQLHLLTWLVVLLTWIATQSTTNYHRVWYILENESFKNTLKI